MTDVQMPSSPVISPRSTDTPPAPLDGDYDEEFHANVTPPPPPPPPPSANDNNDGPSEIPTQKQEQLSREPLEPLSPDGELQHYSFSHDTPKEQSGCDPNVQLSPKTTSQIPTKPITNKPPIGNRPPKPQSSGSSTKEEYGTGIDAMLENIEKEFMMIRTQGSFQFHQKNLSNKAKRLSSRGDLGENNENNGNCGTNQPSNSGNETPPVENANVGSLLKETMYDISSAMESLKSAIQQTSAGKNPLSVDATCGKIDDSATAFGEEDDSLCNKESPLDNKEASAAKSLGNTGSGTPAELMKKMHDAFRKVVVDATGDKKDSAKKSPQANGIQGNNSDNADAWGVGNILANGLGFAGSEDDDDGRSQATYDTWDEENSVLRRLGSWGTVNSQITAGTIGTAATFGTMATCETEGQSVIGPVSLALAAATAKKQAEEGISGADGQPQNGDQLIVPPGSQNIRKSPVQLEQYDDDGKLIDPALVEAAMKKRREKESKKKRRRRPRKRVVKFDYPPISSLRQYPRPDPEDLPKLFFTEDELDQIEDDRYSTMSTDDIEIVAVSSKEGPKSPNSADNDNGLDARAQASKKSAPEHEPGCKPVKGRNGTPLRRRPGADGKSSKKSSTETEEPSEPTSPRRLVKGVQIYLRERSTGT